MQQFTKNYLLELCDGPYSICFVFPCQNCSLRKMLKTKLLVEQSKLTISNFNYISFR